MKKIIFLVLIICLSLNGMAQNLSSGGKFVYNHGKIRISEPVCGMAFVNGSPSTLALTSSSGSSSVSVTSNSSWTVTGTIPSWTTITNNTGTGNGTIYFTYQSNLSSSRSFTLQVRTLGACTPVSASTTITQSGTGIGTTYYVSNSGSDSNNGTSTGTPFATLTKVNSLSLNPGDQVLFQSSGTWYGSLTINQSGNSTYPITYGSYGTGVKPVITGFTTVSGWTNTSGNIWQTNSSVSSLSHCNIVTINGVNSVMGRYPLANAGNGGFLNVTSSPSSTSVTSSSLTGTPNYTGAEIVISSANYKIERSVITSQSSGTLHYAATSSGPVIGNGFFIQNLPSCLTQQNDWCLLSNGKIDVYSTSQPSNVNVASVDSLVTINGNYITIQNLTLTGANNIALYIPNISGYYNNIIVQNCTFKNIGQSAVYGNCSYLTIQSDSILNSNTNAISINYGSNIIISNNYLHNIGVLAGMRSSFVTWTNLINGANSALGCATTTNFTVNNNQIINTGYGGITFFGTGMLIQNNFVDTFCMVIDDGGGIYSYRGGQSEQTNQVIDHNIIINGIGNQYGVPYRFPAAGIYLDNNSKNFIVTNNSCSSNYEYGIFLNANQGNTQISNNIVYNSNNYQLWHDELWSSGTYPINTITHNQFIARTDTNLSNNSSFQKAIGFYCADASISGTMTSTRLDSNYYARPYADNYTITYNWNALGGGNRNATLASWKTTSGQDTHTFGSPEAVSSVNDILFYYNWSNSPLVQSLPFPCMDITGTVYPTSYTIPAYGSVVLLKN